jgi:hypothetical protein
MLAKFSKSPFLNLQKRVLTRTFIATPVVKYENDRPSFNSYAFVPLRYGLISKDSLRALCTLGCIEEQNTSVLALAMANPTWESAVLIKPEAMIISVMSVTNAEVVSVASACRARADVNAR